jgi:hypothetical protein
MRSRRLFLVVFVGVLLIVGVTGFVSPYLQRYELSRRLNSLVLQATVAVAGVTRITPSSRPSAGHTAMWESCSCVHSSCSFRA